VIEIFLILIIAILSALLYFQYKVLGNKRHENSILKIRISSTLSERDLELKEKSEKIAELEKREKFMKLDQSELSKEHNYLKERNEKLKKEIVALENRKRALES
jgi:hypothetical protein